MPCDVDSAHDLRSWLPVLRRRPDASLRLFCIPYAGGSIMAYTAWPAGLPAWVEPYGVQLPGRWNRIQEPPLTRLEEVVAAIAGRLPALLDRPFALFGHSMGAVLAFEVTRELRRRGLPQPRALLVSGRRAPHIVDEDGPDPGAPDAEFIERLRVLRGTPREVLEHDELMTLLLPALRADFGICRAYRCVPGAPLACPVTALGGADDPEVRNGRLEAWRLYTRNTFDCHLFPGDHFYLHTATGALLERVAASLDRIAGAPD